MKPKITSETKGAFYRKTWFRITLCVGFVVVVFIVLNAGYFLKELEFRLHGLQPEDSTPVPVVLATEGQQPPAQPPAAVQEEQPPTQPGQPVQQPQPGQAPPAAKPSPSTPPYPCGKLEIASLNIHVPVICVSQASEKVYQAALINGVVHFPGSAMPGQLGNDYIFGHSSDYIWSKGKYKSVFALLPHIENGAEIRLSDATGQVYVYKVFDHRVVAAADVSVISQGGYKKKILTVQTSYPVGTALARYVAVAELVQ